MLTATFMQLLDVTIVQVSVAEIQRDLHVGAGPLELVLAGYTLTYACTLIAAARLGDRYGYRRLFVVGLTTFVVASALCGSAPSATVLVRARLVQGIGSGTMAPQVLSIIQTALPPDRRSRALSRFGATMGVASLSGPLLGGLLLGLDLFGLGWRVIFLINVPIGLLALAGSALLPAVRGCSDQVVDYLGAILLALGLGSLLLALALGPGAGWPAWTWLSLGTAALALVTFALSQKHRRAPLVHPSVVQDSTCRSGIVLVLVFNAGVPVFTYLLLLHLQSGRGMTPLQAALTNAPYATAAFVGSLTAPAMANRLGSRLLVWCAIVLAVAMTSLSLVLTASVGVLLVVLTAGGAAFGAFTASVFSLVLAQVRPDAVGSASGLLPTAQQLGGSLGTALGALVYFGTAAEPVSSFAHALYYEVGIFGLTALLADRLARSENGGAGREKGPSPWQPDRPRPGRSG